jgi:Tfp pilus assembly protein PilN
MIQLNLLPDVKLEFIKAQGTRRLITSVSILASSVAIGILILLLIVSGLQHKHLKDLTKDIRTDTQKLQQKPEISKILTVQNQLEGLTSLHASKPAASRVFNYLNQVTPAQVAINNMSIDFTAHTVSITGTADALSSVNQYVDTLKFTKFNTTEDDSKTKAFSDVVLSSFALSTGNKANQPADYTITFSYDPAIFDITKDVQLSVPSETTTRSSVDQPTDLFQGPAANTNKAGQ